MPIDLSKLQLHPYFGYRVTGKDGQDRCHFQFNSKSISWHETVTNIHYRKTSLVKTILAYELAFGEFGMTTCMCYDCAQESQIASARLLKETGTFVSHVVFLEHKAKFMAQVNCQLEIAENQTVGIPTLKK